MRSCPRMRVLGLATILACGGCAIVEKQSYFVPTSEFGKKRPIDHEETVLHTNLEPRVAVAERDSAQFSVSIRGWKSSVVLMGPLLPVIPGFLVNWWAAQDSRDQGALVVFLDVATGGQSVTVHPYETLLRVDGRPELLHPTRVMIGGFRNVLGSSPEASTAPTSVECPESVDLPSAEYRAARYHAGKESAYRLELEFAREGIDRAERVDVSLPGIRVNEADVLPIDVALAWRGGWEWVMGGP